MRVFLTVSLFLFTTLTCSFGQTKRSIRLKSLGKDSVKLSFDENYNMIEDSCSKITRYARYNFKLRKFTGKFKDVSVVKPKLILSEGSYTPAGLKSGNFQSRYLNGNLQAQVGFKDNKLDGRGRLYYKNGSPKVIFEASGNDIKIIDAWDLTGRRIVEKGQGIYRVELGKTLWQGKLVNGKPEGLWKGVQPGDRSNAITASEIFVTGQFQQGSSPTGNYTNKSRIILINESEMPFINAEQLKVSSIPCYGAKRKKIVYARYMKGEPAYNGEIKKLLNPILGKIDVKKKPANEWNIEGYINEMGKLSDLRGVNTNDNITTDIIKELKKLPAMNPASIDGRVIRQKVIINIIYNGGVYNCMIRFLPIDTD